MPIRSFNLNSPEAYEALAEPRARPWIPAGSLPRRPRWGEHSDPLWVSAETDAEAEDAACAWQWHLEEGRIGLDGAISHSTAEEPSDQA